MSGRTPPHNIEAEESLLGAMLLAPSAIDVARPLVIASDFYRPAHAHVFQSAVDLYGEGKPVDPVTVSDLLGRRGLLEQVGGNGMLVSLQARTPATSSAGRYARIVAELATLRRMIGVAGDIAELAYGTPEDVEGALERAREALGRVRSPIGSLPPELWELNDYIDWEPERDNRTVEWVIPGLLKEMDRAVFVAGEGSGKSTLLRQFALATAKGMHPLAMCPIPPQPTVLIDLENPPYLVRDRLAAMRGLARGIDRGMSYVWHRPSGIELLKPAGRSQLESILATVQPKLVVAGPLGKMTRGNRLDDAVMTGLWDVLDDFRERYNFAWIVEHHAPLEQQGKRPMRAYGPSVTTTRPEYGFGLVAEGDTRLKLVRFRKDRDPRAWPESIHHGGPGLWPWQGRWENGYELDELRELSRKVMASREAVLA